VLCQWSIIMWSDESIAIIAIISTRCNTNTFSRIGYCHIERQTSNWAYLYSARKRYKNDTLSTFYLPTYSWMHDCSKILNK